MKKDEIRRVLRTHQLWLVSNGKKGEQADFSGADLRGADLRYSDFRDADLEGTRLADARLEGAKFRCADLAKADDWRGLNLDVLELQGSIENL